MSAFFLLHTQPTPSWDYFLHSHTQESKEKFIACSHPQCQHKNLDTMMTAHFLKYVLLTETTWTYWTLVEEKIMYTNGND